MNVQWVVLTGFATVFSAGLSVLGKPQYKTAMRIWAISCGLLFAGFLAGPPIDQYAGAIVIAASMFTALWYYITN
jgi:hypothetical protein